MVVVVRPTAAVVAVAAASMVARLKAVIPTADTRAVVQQAATPVAAKKAREAATALLAASPAEVANRKPVVVSSQKVIRTIPAPLTMANGIRSATQPTRHMRAWRADPQALPVQVLRLTTPASPMADGIPLARRAQQVSPVSAAILLSAVAQAGAATTTAGAAVGVGEDTAGDLA